MRKFGDGHLNRGAGARSTAPVSPDPVQNFVGRWLRLDDDRELVADQIRLLMQGHRYVFINLLNASLACSVFWRLIPHWAIGAWLGAFSLVLLARSFLQNHFIAAAPGCEAAQGWGRAFVLVVFAAGLLWGATALLVLVTPDALEHVFLVFVLGGMMAGSMVSFSAYAPAMLAFIMPAVLPLIVILIGRGDLIDVEMGVMMAAFAVVCGSVGRRINHSIAENFRLRIDQGRLLIALSTSSAVLAEAQAIAHVGSWVHDVEANSSTWSAEMFRILGLDPATATPSHELLLAHVHEADRPMVEDKHTGALGAATDRTVEFRIVRGDGAIRWIHESRRATCDSKGRALRVDGTLQDISDVRQAADVLRYLDRLSRGIAESAAGLIGAATLDAGMSRALRLLGEILAVDRFMMLRNDVDPEKPPRLCHLWEAPTIAVNFDEGALSAAWQSDRAAALAWREALAEGKPVSARLDGSEGAMRVLLERLHNKSTLLVPISVGGKVWGNFGIDACAAAREWTGAECDTLSIFADVTGSLIQRDAARLQLERSESRIRLLNETALDAIITINGAGTISAWNAAAERTLGYGAADAIGQQVHELLAPARFRSIADPAMQMFLKAGTGAALGRTTALGARRKDGAEIEIELALSGALVGSEWEAIGILRDVTARMVAQRQIEFANLLLQTQMEASLDGILIVDGNLKIIRYNGRFAEIWKVPLSLLAAADDRPVLAMVGSQIMNQAQFHDRVKHLETHPGEDSQDELKLTDGRTIERYTVTLYSPVREYLGRAWFFRDVTARKQAEALALRMARFDALTGLANRDVFVDALGHAIAIARRGGEGFAVIYLDLDHFKDVNDTLGHPVGDELLKAVADRLRSSTRATDTVARFGGDEFAVVASDTADPADAALLADKLIRAINAPFSIVGNDIHTGASIGIAAYGPDATDAETLLSHADVALYRAKSEGRGKYRFFTEEMDVEVQNRVTLGGELRVAIDAGQLFLMYQPQVIIDTGQITGVEALVRWRHPRRGVIGPDSFIRVAEQIGVIAKLGHWVLWAACRQAKTWRDAGIEPVQMCVNVSALQLRMPREFEADVAAALAETGMQPRLLELELTESVLMDTAREHAGVLQRLRSVGVSIAIDDFGTGYSSLDYLRRFRSNRLKIAQTFVSNLDATSESASIIRATISLARELGMGVIAEGVETRKQLELLRGWGCTQIQGYYYSRPLGAEDATRVLRAGVIVTEARERDCEARDPHSLAPG